MSDTRKASSAVVLRDQVPVGLLGRRDLLRLVARPAAPAPTSEPAAASKEPARHGSWRTWDGWRWLCLPFLG